MLPTFQMPVTPIMLLQNAWKQQLDPLLGAPLASLVFVKNIALKNGVTVINHGLGRNPQGWFITDIDGAATVYRSAPFNNLTLTLTSNAIANINVGVF